MVASAMVKDINRMLEFGNLFKIKKVGREGGAACSYTQGGGLINTCASNYTITITTYDYNMVYLDISHIQYNYCNCVTSYSWHI